MGFEWRRPSDLDFADGLRRGRGRGRPGGLAPTVHAASEGLSVLVLEQRAFDGAAGASARIENYLGFLTGISGQALAARMWTKAPPRSSELTLPQPLI
jgi:thioredoxin reductase (NADPH)